jgi:AraC-like DNA-binding protein
LVHAWHELHERRRADPQHLAVLQACRLLEADLPGQPDMRRIAQQVGLSYERFRKVFRARIGSSPGAWLRSRRLDAARTQLLERRGAIAAVARDLGFASATAFVRHFRQQMGVTPGQWRRGG